MTAPCEGAELVATLDEGTGASGFLFAVGGTQTRVGPHRLYERLAAALAARGHPVFRYDRRGVGDSDGEDPGFAASGPDLAAAAAAFRAACPQMTHVTGFGLCDGATALALNHRALGLDALVLANPWVIEPVDDLPPAAAIASTYRQRLTDRAAWKRVLTGGIDYRKAARGVWRLVVRQENASLAHELFAALAATATPVTVVLCSEDGTAQAFAEAWKKAPAALAKRARVETMASGGHTFPAPAEFEALARVLEGS